ncbi:hypothetical protein QZH41_006316 [Actinostola sp. cb2023]|nr:hypothetical protein QZH41_006316 [Actinostola sp. cb2023]
MKQQHVLNCSFSSWYPRFKNVTIRSRIIPLPKDFIDYLNADSIVLPGKPYTQSRNSDDESDSEEWQSREEDPDQETAQAPEFNEIETKIREEISDLGGSVFPKLNWSAPKDASWITHDSTIKCKNANDVYLVLKSSDIIAEELSNPFKQCEDSQGNVDMNYDLVLRKWMEVYPGMEFRCFVKNQELVAISQRDISSYYPFIKEHQEDIVTDILSFYENKIAELFPDACYVFDVYRYAEQQVLLVDFSPFGPPTNPLLFSWAEFIGDELLQDDDVPIFRAVTSELGVQPSPYVCSHLPKDMIDLTTGEDINKLVDFLNVGSLIQKPAENDNES